MYLYKSILEQNKIKYYMVICWGISLRNLEWISICFYMAILLYCFIKGFNNDILLINFLSIYLY